MIVRDATFDDLLAVRDVYNALITTTTVAWTEVHETIEQRRDWFGQWLDLVLMQRILTDDS